MKSGNSTTQCKSFKNYLGHLPPRCNGGTPCKACLKLYSQRGGRDR